ncbi:MAG: hypothetical protein HY689_01685 [Chloroflexi bacterium]|nr:hypothetical protein [Chloroflexota bacterium]
MEQVVVQVQTEGPFRASEIVADLQNAAVALYHPLRPVTYWDGSNRSHLCPHERQTGRCPHILPPDDPEHVDYRTTAEREFRARLEVCFPHAQVCIYLA